MINTCKHQAGQKDMSQIGTKGKERLNLISLLSDF